MRAFTKFLAGGATIAALASAAPAAAQYYPGYGSPGYGYGNPNSNGDTHAAAYANAEAGSDSAGAYGQLLFL